MESMFPSAMVTDYADLIDLMRNQLKDRHVLAAAVKCRADIIVSDNRKHFPPESLAPYGIECLTADSFLERQYHSDPERFVAVLAAQASDIGLTLATLISKHVPSLSRLVIVR